MPAINTQAVQSTEQPAAIHDTSPFHVESLPMISSAVEKALVRKLDTKLLPYLCLMYLFAALDRSSLGTIG
jgi:hypothetical protein